MTFFDVALSLKSGKVLPIMDALSNYCFHRAERDASKVDVACIMLISIESSRFSIQLM